MSDYGPVPASQLAVESRRVSEALAEGRRVLVSDQGRVVAALEPDGWQPSPAGTLDIAEQERLLVLFEQSHLNATAAEFVAEVERVRGL